MYTLETRISDGFECQSEGLCTFLYPLCMRMSLKYWNKICSFECSLASIDSKFYVVELKRKLLLILGCFNIFELLRQYLNWRIKTIFTTRCIGHQSWHSWDSRVIGGIMVLSQRFVGCVGCKERGLRELRLRHFDNPPLRNGATTVAILLYCNVWIQIVPGCVSWM